MNAVPSFLLNMYCKSLLSCFSTLVMLHKGACTKLTCAKSKSKDESFTVVEVMDRRSKILYLIKLDVAIFTHLCPYYIDICLTLPSIFHPRISSKNSFSFPWFCNVLSMSHTSFLKLLTHHQATPATGSGSGFVHRLTSLSFCEIH